ncbi:DUF1800 domain-containing protein [Loktanella sp. IMCC34160]|uniref:DUF1800 domain-containing protein n=1 Tax=Loktanella sp. IMCC34160 TaxID=2510646 RepID=UPI00101C7974|nr:DUF1800 domain-containing protein [Loktanella sp. IMCC34160]RYG90719.1 DUF1800 domain-containing protein [Loktanella sp. IMCC34160]
MFDPVIAETRFGMGLSPQQPLPTGVEDMMVRLAGPDLAAARFPIPTYDAAYPSLGQLTAVSRDRNAARRAGQDDQAEQLEQERRDMLRAAQVLQQQTLAATLARAIDGEDGLRERLVRFWADHFTVTARVGGSSHLVTPFVETAIRPHVTGRFVDMLMVVTLHPMMLLYLDQTQSVGPDSRVGGGGRRGLNENLAREVLELHTMGVAGGYAQDDVRQLAELFTGLTLDEDRAFWFRTEAAEPGEEVVLGQTYGPTPQLAEIRRALFDIAARPETARHIAQKLAVHFVSDRPAPDLVAALAEDFMATGGDLLSLVRTLLDHPAAWAAERAKVKDPFSFIAASLRALGVSGAAITGLGPRILRRDFVRPLGLMGQPWENPVGPDGWPEEPEAWVTPQGMAARINWALSVPRRMVDRLPMPMHFVTDALGPNPAPAVVQAARDAPNRRDGVAVILCSAAFQRR